LLDQLEQVDGAVEKGGLELALEIDIVSSSVVLVSIEIILVSSEWKLTAQFYKHIGSSKPESRCEWRTVQERSR
jgi:hypothetical protein